MDGHGAALIGARLETCEREDERVVVECQAGRHAFSRACEAAGLTLDDEALVLAFARFKARADEGRTVSIHELMQEVTVS